VLRRGEAYSKGTRKLAERKGGSTPPLREWPHRERLGFRIGSKSEDALHRMCRN
jgi:hypothetical protein